MTYTKLGVNLIMAAAHCCHGVITARAACSKKSKFGITDSIISGIGIAIASNSIVKKCDLVASESARFALIGECAGLLAGAVYTKIEQLPAEPINIKIYKNSEEDSINE